MPEELSPAEHSRRRRRRHLRDLVRAAVFAGVAFAFCAVADRYRLSPSADLTPAEALSRGGVRWACLTEDNGQVLLAVMRDPFDPLHWLGLGSAAVYVFDVPGNRLIDWTVDVGHDPAFERRDSLWRAASVGWSGTRRCARSPRDRGSKRT